MERIERINEEVKKEISTMIQNDLKDPRISGIISVTKVHVTKDLKFAQIYISILGADKAEVMEGIKSSAGFMRKELGKRMQIRILPELQFKLDESMEYGTHIDEVIKNLNK
jgi:ribosome-binding factor A